MDPLTGLSSSDMKILKPEEKKSMFEKNTTEENKEIEEKLTEHPGEPGYLKPVRLFWFILGIVSGFCAAVVLFSL
jgi:hypothetical protein